MATSYTSLLGLALPVTGELAGTWGDTVNNSITALLDTAVAGTTTLSTDADVTLTTTTGASNQARQAILLCSGARTALRTITAPAQSKIYVVVNNTTGGYGVKLVGAGPTTGVTVANGKTAVLVWNGSDFVEVAPATATTATNLAGGAAGSVPYQSGANTTTFLSLGTAAQVLQVNAGATAPEWVSSTGTGNVVRATSPTIATPTITTSATVPLLIGGTGTTSTLSLRSTSGVGTTGADIIFQTGNNGATEAMRILNSGNVGIGTNAPTAKLHVYGGGSYTLYKQETTSGTTEASWQNTLGTTIVGTDGAAGYGYIGTFANQHLRLYTNSAERMRIDSSGNVGIGTASPTSPLTVYAANNQAALRVTNGPSANNVGITLESLGGNVVLNNGNGPLEIYTGGSIRAVLTTAGNLGIGTTTPVAKLDIQGTGAVAAVLNQRTDVTSLSASLMFKTAGFNYWAMRQSSGALTWYQDTAVGGTATEYMRIDSSGNLGIGTASPSAKLTVTAAAAAAILTNTASGGAFQSVMSLRSTSPTIGAGIQFYDGTNDGYISWYNQNLLFAGTGGAERMRIDSAGNVGVGVTPGSWGSSWSAIQAKGGALSSFSTTELWLQKNAVTTNSGPVYVVTDFASSYTQVSGQHRWYTAPSGTAGSAITYSQNMTLDASGNLGIGTASPGSKLDVNGNTNITGTLTATSNVSATNSWLFVRGNSVAWPSIVGQVAGRVMVAQSGGNATVVLHDDTAVAANTGPNGIYFTGRSNDTGPAYLPWASLSAYKENATQGNGNGYMQFKVSLSGTGLVERMRIDSSGNVGIGTASPGSKLDVNGNTNITGSLYASGNLGVGINSPGYKVHVFGASPVLTIQDNTSAAAGVGGTINFIAYTSGTAGTNIEAQIKGVKSAANPSGELYFYTSDTVGNSQERARIDGTGNVLVTGVGGLGYGTGSGGAVTQATSRTTGVTLNKTNGAITLVSAAGTTTWQTFTVTNSTVAATDTIIVNQKSGTDLYQIFVTNVAAGSFKITFATTGGTTTEQPVFNFAVIKAVAA